MKFKFIAKDKISHLPKSPGVYAFKKDGQILYIGKATNVRERVKNHFQQPGFRGNLFVNQADKIGYIKTDSEFADPTDHLTSRPASHGSTIEALVLEAKLIKKYQPKYNVMWRDDKNYFYVGITKDDFPRVFVTHQPLRQTQDKPKLKIDYIGPFVEGRVLKQTLNVLRRIFPYRTCKPYTGRPCLWYQLGRCPGSCLLGSKLAKEIPGLKKTIKKESQRNAKNLKRILQSGKNQVLESLKTEMRNASKIRDFERAVKIRDQIWALERILSHSKIFDYPSEAKGGEETEKNLRKTLKIKRRVKRIEAYDVSNMQGQNATGSMVTFINGEPDKNFYRKFKIKIEGKPNDVAMIREVLTRRFQHSEWGWPDLILIDGGRAQLNAALQCLNSKIDEHPFITELSRSESESGKEEIFFDSTFRCARVFKHVKVMALAKKENKLFIEGKKQPVLLKTLPREIFNLILQLRDEAHRFAVAYHRKLRERF